MSIKMAATLLCTAGLGAANAADVLTARGVVFHDRNGNGLRDADERGVSGVPVSNGERVVLTSGDGSYQLDIGARDGHIFVIKPRGYQVPLSELNLPRFAYIHKPDGSPDADFHFRGVAPTGSLPESIDFALTPSAEPERFSIIAFADPQPYSTEEIDLFRMEVVDDVVGRRQLAFGVSLGDLVGDQLELFEPLNEAQALFGAPWYNVYGNHDMNAMAGASAATAADPDRWADETFERVYGPPTFAFQYGRVHFIVLDNVVWQGFRGYRDGTPANWPHARMPDVGNYRGGLRADQLTFIDSYLDVVPKEDLVVLFFHIPIDMDGPGVHRIPEHRRLFEILSSHPHTFSMSGHTHTQRHWFFGQEHGYMNNAPNQHNDLHPDRFSGPVHHHLNAVTASGSWYNGLPDEEGVPHTTMRCGAPNGYTLVHFDGNRYATDFVPARRDPDDRMTLTFTDDAGALGGADRLVANIFNGAPGDAVAWRLIQGPGAPPTPWAAMTFTRMEDPLYARIHAAQERLPEDLRTAYRLPAPIESAHIWTARLPAEPPAGTHLIEVRHTDLYGRTSINRRSVRR